MKKLTKKDIISDDSKTYFMFSAEEAEFIKKVKSEFGLTNSELGRYCLDLLKAVIQFPEIVDYINNLGKK